MLSRHLGLIANSVTNTAAVLYCHSDKFRVAPNIDYWVIFGGFREVLRKFHGATSRLDAALKMPKWAVRRQKNGKAVAGISEKDRLHVVQPPSREIGRRISLLKIRLPWSNVDSRIVT